MLDKIDECEFVLRLNLPRSIKVSVGLNFECVYCGEGKSKGRKRRAFILINSRRYNYNTYHCQNCGKSISFKNFLKDHDSVLYEEYLEKEKTIYLDKLKKKKSLKLPVINTITESDIDDDSSIKYFDLLDSDGFLPAFKVKNAVNYCIKRKIPKEVFLGFYYNDDIVVDKDDKKFHYRNMLVMPFYDKTKIYGYQARSIKKKVFYTYSQEGFKIYNFFNIEPNSRVYVFESIIDSLYIPNSIAMVGASLSKDYEFRLDDFVYVFDNDRSRDTYQRMEKVINDGHKVVIWPNNFKYKDINEAIIKGVSKQTIKEIIDSNIKEGIYAMINLKVLQGRKKKS